MFSFSECHNLVEKELSRIDFDNRAPGELYEPIQYILSLGGKRIRPVTTLMSCNLFTDDILCALKPAVSIEVFHNFTLVHDDIMDHAPIRRNKPTVHAKWNNNVAILSGDAMQIVAYELLCESDPELLKALIGIFNCTALQVCEGQQYDMNFSVAEHVSLDEYLQMIELKTSVLLAAGLKMGAICGKASNADAQKLYDFGRNLGLAFQIQDDFLDVYSNQEEFGKTTGGDIAENKKTFLLIKAIELAKGENARILMHAVQNMITDVNEKIGLVKQVYDRLNIRELTIEKIKEYSQHSYANLDSVNVPGERKEQLFQLVGELMNRKK